MLSIRFTLGVKLHRQFQYGKVQKIFLVIGIPATACNILQALCIFYELRV